MTAKSTDIGPISFIPLNLERSSGDDNQEPAANEWPGPTDECCWFPRPAEIAAECATEMRKRIEEKVRNWTAATTFRGEACIAPPILDREIGFFPGEVLLSWVHFNPYRPIVSNLWYVELPGATEGLLTFFKQDFIQRQSAVFGLIPGAFNEAAIAEAATALFAANGHESCVLINALPTSIGHRENWGAETVSPLFGSKLAKALFRFPAVDCWRKTDMTVCCDHLRRFSDPWDRADAAVNYRDKVDSGTEAPHVTEFSERAFDEWFDLVTDPAHVEAERREFGRARLGAFELRRLWRLQQEQQADPHDPSK